MISEAAVGQLVRRAGGERDGVQLINEVRVVLFLVTPRLKMQMLAGEISPTRK